jgi:mono/diheme cytochrome c family protein
METVAVKKKTNTILQTSLLHGEKLFNTYCAACHQLGGQGVEGRVPPLDNSPWVAGSENRLVRIVLKGLRGPIEIHGEMYNMEMPAFGPLFKDDDVAAILTYVRQRYGAPSPPVTTETVARVRRATKDRNRYWTVKELLLVP